jgi:D-3-phosphoglycerate dehydrogenase
MKAFISTYPFGITSDEPLRLLRDHGIDFRVNENKRKMTTSELADEIRDADILIAGTEIIDESVFNNAPKLKFISRVGIGLDNIDFELCKKYNVRVAFTPDAPTMAVAELCVGLLIDLCRKITETNNQI